MILKTPKGDVQYFAAFDSSTPIPRNSQWGSSSFTGRTVGLNEAAGLPAFLRALRLLSETPAGFPIGVFRGYDADREPAKDAPQVKVLRHPSPDHSPFQVWDWVFKSMCRGNAYLWKVKNASGAVEYLYPVDPRVVTPKYEGGKATFEIRERGQVKQIVGRETILHIPGILLEHPCIGVSLVDAFRNSLGTQVSRQEFEARYLVNNGKPGAVLKTEGSPSKEQRAEMREGFESRHSGSGNAGSLAMVWGGWDLSPWDLSLEDAQFIEAAKFSVQDIGRMTGIPSGFLNDPEAPGGDTPEQENMRFLQYGLKPWMDRLESGLASDKDLFPDDEMYPQLDPSELLRPDIKTRYEAYRLARQGGWITGNEIRRDEGRPDIEGGDELQQTPVGGAANPQKTPQGDDQELPDNE